MARPSFRPNKDLRKLVKGMAALGVPHEKIVIAVGIRSPKTLRKHFRRELATGAAEANATVARVAFEMAVSGTYPEMTDFWLYIMDDPAQSTCPTDDALEQAQTKSTCELIFADPDPSNEIAQEAADAST
jgi:hypothetical protein